MSESDHSRQWVNCDSITGWGKIWTGLRIFQWWRFVIDEAAWSTAIRLAIVIRLDGTSYEIQWVPVLWLMLYASLLQLVQGLALRVYLGRHSWGSFECSTDIIATTFAVTAVLFLWTAAMPQRVGVPRSVILIAAPIATLLMASIRGACRFSRERGMKGRKSATPIVLYGAGYVGSHLARLLTTDKNSEMVPVAILDDDPSKRFLRTSGINVAGTFADFDRIVEITGAQIVIIAFGDPDRELLERVQERAWAHEMRVLVCPSIEEMLRTGVSQHSLRDLDIEDLLGRDQVDTDISAIAGYLNGKTVLVTGAGGSIGQQLCVEIAKHDPGELIMLDRDETGLQGTEIQVRGNGLLDTNEVVLADIRDAECLRELFTDRQPEVVFHAAALKHLPMLERYPEEAWKTNVLGTLNVLEAARDANVEVLINISTDKAANPTSVLGLSKRMAERLTAWAGDQSNCRYLSVRFGNVIGSRGSMLPTFRELIERGKPLTVTHPDITRYFMTIPEACQLVLQAGAVGGVGEVLILDMGKPVRILDIAQKMIALSGKPIGIQFTGLREGEKLHEDLHSEFEVETFPFHEKISHAPVAKLSPDELRKSDWDALTQAAPAARPALAYRQQNILLGVGE